MWSPDGSRLLFAGPKGFQLFWQASDGSGTPELIAETARAPESWSPATRLVSYITLTGASDYDVWAFSPDDRWLDLYGVSRAGAVLVRPDGHVCWRSAGDAPDREAELDAVLRRILAR